MFDELSKRGARRDAGVSASLAWELEDFLRGMGLKLPLAAATPDNEGQDGTTAHVSHQDFYTICETALAVTKDEALGLRWGEDIVGHMMGAIPALIRHSATLGHALENMIRFSSAMQMEQQLQLHQQGDVVFLQLRSTALDPVPERVWRMIAELTLVGVYRIIDKYCPGPKELRVHLDYPKPSYGEEYTRVFKGQEMFEQSRCGLLFNRVLLNTPSRHRDPQLFEAAQALAEQRCAEAAAESTYATRVFNILTRTQTPQAVSMEEVAHTLGMSARSLQRRLTEEGTSFTAESHRASGAVAKQLMLRGRTIKEAASIMGFVDPSSFSRAFKRWTGVAPGQLSRR